MKIRIVQTVDVDPEAWALDFGIEQKGVREDVKTYFAGWMQQQVEALGHQPDAPMSGPAPHYSFGKGSR